MTKDYLKHDDMYAKCLFALEKILDTIKFVQIGAFDGKLYDELYDKISRNTKYQGLLIEPINSAFEQLKINYQQRADLKFEKVAITEYAKTATMWTIPYKYKEDESIPDWAVGCSTLLFNSNSLFGRHCTEQEYLSFKNKIEYEMVECLPLHTVLEKHEISFQDIDLLHIDAEGYDWLIIKQLPLEFAKPKVIHFEFFNLSNYHYGEVTTHLVMYGYEMYKFENNITAICFTEDELQQLDIKSSGQLKLEV